MAARIIHRRSAGLSPVTSPTQQPLVQQSRMPRDERKPKAPRRWPVALIACLVVSAVLCTGMLVLLRPWMASTAPPPASWQEEQAAIDDDSWCLTLVNADHPLPETFSINTVAVDGGERVDARIEHPLRALFAACEAAGYHPYVRSGFRTRAEQEQTMEDKVTAYMADGWSKADARAEAARWVAQPGTSEHELGLAVDINDREGDEGIYPWLAAHAPEYGFILRYPMDGEAVTGISYEPWHFRYVGLDAAPTITKLGVTLEEYLS